MKNIFSLNALLLACGLLMCSCVGEHEDYDDDGGETGGVLKLKISKTQIMADGDDATIIKVMSGDTEVTAEEGAQVFCPTTNKFYPAPVTFTSRTKGIFEFSAFYQSKTSPVQSVEALAKGDVVDKPFMKKCVIYEFTGTWCTYCPEMVTNIHLVEDKYGYDGKLEIIGVHSSDAMAIPQGDEIKVHYNITGLPSAVIDGRVNSKSTLALLASNIQKSFNDYPAQCGIKISSKVEGSKITADVEALFAESNKYRITAVLLEDGIDGVKRYPQTNGGKDYKHDFVLRSFGVDADNVGLNHLGKDLDMVAGEIYYDTFTFVLRDDYEPSNCRVLVYIHKLQDDELVKDHPFYKPGKTYYINNAATCSIDGSVDYIYDTTVQE